MKPISRLNSPILQTFLPNFKPVGIGGVEGSAVVSAVCHPCDHGADGVDPVVVYSGDVVTGVYGDRGAGRCAWEVAGEANVVGFEDGIVGYPFSLDHPVCLVLFWGAKSVISGVVSAWY